MTQSDATKYTAAKLKLYDLITCAPELTAEDCRVAWRLLSRCGEKYKAAWPAATTIASEIGITLRSVRRSLPRLVEQGWFRPMKGGGRGRSTVYVPCLERVTEESLFSSETVTQESPFTSSETVTQESVNSDTGDRKTVTPESPNTLRGNQHLSTAGAAALSNGYDSDDLLANAMRRYLDVCIPLGWTEKLARERIATVKRVYQEKGLNERAQRVALLSWLEAALESMETSRSKG